MFKNNNYMTVTNNINPRPLPLLAPTKSTKNNLNFQYHNQPNNK